MKQLLGIKCIPILEASSRLAELIMLHAHNQDHRRGPSALLAVARRWAWIIRGRKLAQKVVRACMFCRRRDQKQAEQIMGSVPPEYLKVALPFSVVSLDLFGPLEARDVVKKRTKLKVWGAIYSCLSTKAVAVWCVPGYDAVSFLETHKRHTAIYGVPRVIISDHGSQLMLASKQLQGWSKTRDALDEMGTEWRFTETGCSWRNGLAERAIQQIKKTFLHLAPAMGELTVLQLETLFLQAAMIANRRPISARVICEDEWYAITPADLLLGRATEGMLSGIDSSFWAMESEVAEALPNIKGRLNALVNQWWKCWIARAFPLMLPRRRWAIEHRNIRKHDVVLLRYDSKVSRARYRLARVAETHPDQHGVVRTVTVALRDRVGVHNEPLDVCRTELQYLRIGIQRLHVILPAEEQGLEEDTLLPKHTPRRHKMTTRAQAKQSSSESSRHQVGGMWAY